MHYSASFSLIAVLAAVCPLAVAAETAIDLPARRPGQWEIRMVTEKPSGVPAITSQVCIDPATDRELMDFGLRMVRGKCKHYTMKHEGRSFVIDAECALGPIHSTTRTTLSGDFQSSYTMRIEGTAQGSLPIQGAGKGPQQTLMVHTARWTGAACTGGMVPGDISMGKGIKFNVKQMKGLAKLLPQLHIK